MELSLILTVMLGLALFMGAVLVLGFIVLAIANLLFRAGGWFSIVLYSTAAFGATLLLGLVSFMLWLRA